MNKDRIKKAYFHLPGLFEFYELYRVFLPLFSDHREYFYDWCEIGSVYGAPSGCIWGGGRVEEGYEDPGKVLELMEKYEISARLTFSNSLIRKEHLTDRRCNALCALFEDSLKKQSGVIVHSDLLLDHIKRNYPGLYFVSSTTKVLTDFSQFMGEVNREEFLYAVPDFRLNKSFDKWKTLSQRKTRWNFYVMNAAGSDAGTEKAAMRLSAAKIWERTARSTIARLLTPVMVIVFQRQWKIRDLSASKS